MNRPRLLSCLCLFVLVAFLLLANLPNARLAAGAEPAEEPPYDARRASRLAAEALRQGDAEQGARIFSQAKTACLSCHRIGRHGGTVGPDLSTIGKDRSPLALVESLLWPNREIKPPYLVWQVATVDGRVISGYDRREENGMLSLRDPASGRETRVPVKDVEAQRQGRSPMPAGLTAAMSPTQQRDLIRFLSELGRDGQPLSPKLASILEHGSMHGPATFPLERAPLVPEHWPHAGHPVNRARLYDFYARQADYFREQPHVPMLLAPFPGLDGGEAGHWGVQTEQDWSDDRWNATQLGSLQAGVFRAAGKTVPRGVCVRLGENGELAACFNPDTLTYEAVWKGGFVRFSAVRHGFLHGLQMEGEPLPTPDGQRPRQPFKYRGFYRHGQRVVFAYRIGDVEYLDAPWAADGQFVREVAPVDQHSLRFVARGGPAQWPQVLETRIVPGQGKPYAVDTIELPVVNPWNALLFPGGHDFLPDGSALVCTIQGDVWRVSGLDSGTSEPGAARWRRFASGLHHALGLVVHEEQVYVQCRDQLTRLTDLNGDGEADFYECFSNAFQTSPAGHDFICGLQRDQHGNFYTASGNQGLVRISPDGSRADVIATGFRNPDGLGLLPDGTLTVPCSEGEWTPASMICAASPSTTSPSTTSPSAKETAGQAGTERANEPIPHYGYRGPREGRPPALPLVYLPRGLDNSSGGQAYVDSSRWGPLGGQLLHFSFGMGRHFLVLRDRVDEQLQGAVVPLVGDFRSGVHRGRFHPRDGQLYVTGMDGWVSFTVNDGCFERVRYTGDPVQVPTGFHVHENGVVVRFAQPLDRDVASDVTRHFAQCWNYRYSGAYGSPELSTTHPGVAGHDPLRVTAAHVLEDGRSVFLELPELQPVNQLHLRLRVNRPGKFLSSNPSGEGHDLFLTVHRLDRPFQNFPGYVPREKTIAAHPLLTDMALQAKRVPNPWARRLPEARPVRLATGKNLSYTTRELRVRAGERLALTLSNPDVVPHNWVLARPGTLRAVGELANRLIADPEAFIRHYIPETDDVLAYTDIVAPGEQQTIYFEAPAEPGTYPFLCTFPGHWMVMNGVLIVE